MTRFFPILVVLLASSAIAQEIALEQVASGLVNAVAITHAGD